MRVLWAGGTPGGRVAHVFEAWFSARRASGAAAPALASGLVLALSAWFVPVGTWRRRVGARGVLRVALLTVVVYFWLELWASFRILPLQLLHLLMRAGHRPDLRRALDARIAAILSEPASGWRRPDAAPGGRPALATQDSGGAR